MGFVCRVLLEAPNFEAQPPKTPNWDPYTESLQVRLTRRDTNYKGFLKGYFEEYYKGSLSYLYWGDFLSESSKALQ